MEKDQFLMLLSKKLSRAITVEEQKALDKAIETNKQYQQLADQLSRYFKQRKTKNLKTAKLRDTWAMIAMAEQDFFEDKFDFTAQKNNNGRFYFLKIAAILCVVMGTCFIGYKYYKSTDTDHENIATTNAKTFTILADGTKIWLNKQSDISFNKEFGKNKREIVLTGEAYFDVVKNAQIPLLIHAGDLKIEVKGTAFNVNAYKNQHHIQVSLIRGSIEISEKSNKIPIISLKPNEKFTYINNEDNLNNRYMITPLNAQVLLKEVKWIADTLTFNKEQLKDLTKKMEVKYGLKIEIRSEHLKEKRFSGTFTTETIQQALEALKLSYPLTYTINNTVVIIRD